MKQLIATISLLLLPMTANAEEWYAGIAGGSTNLDFGITDVVGATADKTGTGASVFIGKQVNEWFSIDGFYTDLGEGTVSGENGDSYKTRSGSGQFLSTGKDVLSVKTIGFVGKAGMSNGRFRTYLKGGYHFWDKKVVVNRAGVITSAEFDGDSTIWGVGTEYKMTEKTALLLGYNNYKLGGDSATFFHAGVLFKF